MPLKLGKAGFDLITESEEFRAESYLDPVGIWTIGYGTTMLNGCPVGPDMEINHAVALALFFGWIQSDLNSIEKLVKISINQNQIDALASFVYNIGRGGFSTSSLLAAINSKSPIVENLWTRWNKGRVNGKLVVLRGLTKRRKKEYELYMRPV